MVHQETNVTIESEFIAFIIATTYAVWIRRFIRDLKLGLANGIISVFSDNNFTISIIKSGLNNSKTNHTDVDYHYIINIVKKCEVEVDNVTFEEMVADPMTKGLSLERFKENIAKMGIFGPKDVQGIGCYMRGITGRISWTLEKNS